MQIKNELKGYHLIIHTLKNKIIINFIVETFISK